MVVSWNKKIRLDSWGRIANNVDCMLRKYTFSQDRCSAMGMAAMVKLTKMWKNKAISSKATRDESINMANSNIRL